MKVKRNNHQKRQAILTELQRIAQSLGVKTLTKVQYEANTPQISTTTIAAYFGKWSLAVKAAGLSPGSSRITARQRAVPKVKLLKEIIRLTRTLQKPPTYAELSLYGKYCEQCYRKHWGTFTQAKKVAYAQYGNPTFLA